MTDMILENVASELHEAWVHWSTNIALKEHISVDRLHRWQNLWVSYEQLPEAEKEKDREWARKIIAIIREEKK